MYDINIVAQKNFVKSEMKKRYECKDIPICK